MPSYTCTAALSDVVLDLVAILEEAADFGRLVGGEDILIETVTTDGYVGCRHDRIVLGLSNGETVELVVDLRERVS
jgi:hypothetical protein